MIYEEGCLVVLCIWHFTGYFDIHVYVEESPAYHFALILRIPVANDVPSASISTERMEIEILLGSIFGLYCRFIPSERRWSCVAEVTLTTESEPRWGPGVDVPLRFTKTSRLKGKYAEEIGTEFGCILALDLSGS